MRLRCLAGAYAGQEREYSVIAGLAALKNGTAARIGEPCQVAPVAAIPVAPLAKAPKASGSGWKHKGR